MWIHDIHNPFQQYSKKKFHPKDKLSVYYSFYIGIMHVQITVRSRQKVTKICRKEASVYTMLRSVEGDETL